MSEPIKTFTPQQLIDVVTGLGLQVKAVRDDGTVLLDAEHQQPASEPEGYVYFVTCGPFVKIGFSLDVKHRIAGIQSSNPRRVDLVAVIRGTPKIEGDFHDKFAIYRRRGEWFEYAEEIAAEVRSIIASGLDVADRL